jgi:hypothetical protein
LDDENPLRAVIGAPLYRPIYELQGKNDFFIEKAAFPAARPAAAFNGMVTPRFYNDYGQV